MVIPRFVRSSWMSQSLLPFDFTDMYTSPSQETAAFPVELWILVSKVPVFFFVAKPSSAYFLVDAWRS